MPVVMPNIRFDIFRSNYTVGGGTKAATPFLRDQEGHIATIPARHLRMSSTSSVRIQYELRVEVGLDLRIGDILSNIRLLETGDTWIDDTGNIQTWRVIDPFDMAPGPAGYRMAVVERVIGGGPAPI